MQSILGWFGGVRTLPHLSGEGCSKKIRLGGFFFACTKSYDDKD